MCLQLPNVMKRHSVAIAILLLMIPMLGIISSAATPDNITIDGDLSEWDSDTLIDIDSNSSVSKNKNLLLNDIDI